MSFKKTFQNTVAVGGEEPIQALGSAGILLNTVLPSEERKSQIVFKLWQITLHVWTGLKLSYGALHGGKNL